MPCSARPTPYAFARQQARITRRQQPPSRLPGLAELGEPEGARWLLKTQAKPANEEDRPVQMRLELFPAWFTELFALALVNPKPMDRGVLRGAKRFGE